MRILLLGEYSNVHATLAAGLKILGHEVMVASNRDFWKNYPCDIELVRGNSIFAGFKLWLKVLYNLHRFKNFDIVQIINPMFLELKADKHVSILKYLVKHNQKLVLGAYGMDYYWVSENLIHKPLRYSDFNIGEKIRTDKDALIARKDWLGTDKEKLNIYCAEKANAIVTGLYEYDVCYRNVYPEKTTYIPMPIKPLKLKEDDIKNGLKTKDKIIVFIGISKNRSAYKGTDIMLKAANDVQAKYSDKMELRIAEGVPFQEYVEMMRGADIILDQLYSYTPGMNGLEAMNQGIVCLGGGEPENYDILGETELRPIINVEPNYESVYSAIENIILNKDLILRLKLQSIEYIKRYHDYIKVAQKYESLYTKLLCNP